MVPLVTHGCAISLKSLETCSRLLEFLITYRFRGGGVRDSSESGRAEHEDSVVVADMEDKGMRVNLRTLIGLGDFVARACWNSDSR